MEIHVHRQCNGAKVEIIFITILELELYDPVSQILTKTRML